jgi:hypothetical protein
MNPVMQKKQLIKEIRSMPGRDLKIVIEFVDFIREKELEEEILRNRKLISEVNRSKKAWKTGKLSAFINARDLINSK